MTTQICSVTGCTRIVKARGMCAPHYKQLRTKGVVTPTLRSRTANGYTNQVLLTPCRVEIWAAEVLGREAEKQGTSVYYLQRQILEAWAKTKDPEAWAKSWEEQRDEGA